MKKMFNISIIVAALAGLVGLGFYLFTSLTGYLANSAMNTFPIVCTIAALAALAVLFLRGNGMGQISRDLLVLCAGVLLIVSLALFIMGRVSLAADVHFIPVNYPAAEETTLNLSIIGAVFYLISILGAIVAAFQKEI